MLSTLNGASTPGMPIMLYGANGSPLARSTRSARPGRPRNADRTDPAREYTQGGTSSLLFGINGANDLLRLYGNVDDIDITLGWDAKEQMDHDPFCSAALTTRILAATSRPAEIKPALDNLYQNDGDDARANEVAEFMRRCLSYLAQSQRDLNLTAFQLGRIAAKIGHSKAEIVTELRRGGVDDGKRVPVRIKSKNRRNSCFIVDRQMNIVGIAGYTGDYTSYQDPYKLMSGSAGLGGMILSSQLGGGWVLLDRNKWVVITYMPPEDDSPLGRSLYRAVYTAWRMKRDMWPYYLKALDNTAMPFIYATLPETQYSQQTYPLVDGMPDETADKVEMATVLYQAIDQGRQGGVAVGPHTSDAKAIYTAQSGDPFMVARNVFNSEITQGILLQSLATGTDRHMARAAGEVHENILDLAVKHDRRLICESLTRDVMAPLVQMNFPKEYWHLVPSLSFGEVELSDFAAWAEAFSKLEAVGLVHWSQRPGVWSVLGMPQADMNEWRKEIAHNQQLLEAMAQPTVDPVTGKTTPAQLPKYDSEETGKAVTRSLGRKQAGQLQSGF